MTPKEKAKELYNLYKPFAHGHSKEVEDYNAYQCALVTVEEIIKNNPTTPLTGSYIELYSDMIDEAISFWDEVKVEILYELKSL